ncbi:MAG: DUF3341 domain-containing protein [Pirellulales bacterium]|nr:DUF3341 domain-containing protein [Pirellulales bacterium]
MKISACTEKVCVSFARECDLLAAIQVAKQEGLPLLDALTPYPVHGVETAFGWKSSRLTWVCFICGMIGAVGMLWFQHWSAAVSWPLDVGGKPWNSLPSDIPVAFEAAVLLAAFGSVAALFVACRLRPGKDPGDLPSRVTNDRFVLIFSGDSPGGGQANIEVAMQSFHPVEVQTLP